MKLEKSELELETVVSRIRREELDLQPDFQRGEIWDLKRQQRLIDTVLREWYVPAVHIVVNPNGDEVVLDGQQRLVAIRKFFDGEVRVDGMIEPHDERVLRLHGLRYDDLPPADRRAVNRFVLQVIKLREYEPQEPNELFFRLNQSYNLTPPEKRNALHGAARDQVKELVQELARVGLLDSARIGFSNGRLAYDDIIARTCVAVERDNIRQHINNSVVEEFYRTQPFSAGTMDGVRRAGLSLLDQIMASGGKVKFNKGTLQTWLTYCFRRHAIGRDSPIELLARFESDRIRAKSGGLHSGDRDEQAIAEVLRLYDDRASYRVTDVSSVLIRDLAIEIYAYVAAGLRPARDGELLYSQIREDPQAASTLIAQYLEAVRWGDTLIGDGEL